MAKQSATQFMGPVTLSADPAANLQAATKQYVDSTTASGAPDATATTKGKIQLAGDLGGIGSIATSPVLKNVAKAVNVMDYGAVGDGVADDTAAWQNALNTAFLTGSTVWAPSKTFKITAQLDAPAAAG